MDSLLPQIESITAPKQSYPLEEGILNFLLEFSNSSWPSFLYKSHLFEICFF